MEQYNVSGMSCAACQARVEKVVSKVEGVEKVRVSLLTNSMSVEGEYSSLDVKDQELYEKNDFFTKSPRIRRVIETKEIELTSPPPTENNNMQSVLITMGLRKRFFKRLATSSNNSINDSINSCLANNRKKI